MKPKHSVFRAVELMDMAIRIEAHGRAFYEACLHATKDVKLREVFRYLLEQEAVHARVFSAMKEGMDADETLPESYPGELRNYLEAFVEREVFDDPDSASKRVAEIKDPSDAIEAALEFEKQSILFYSGIKSLVRQSEAEQVDRVIAEEHQHVRRLKALREEVTRE